DLDAGTKPADRSRELLQFVWSLAFRTRALRGQFADAGQRGIARIASVDSKTMERAFEREIASNFDQHLKGIVEKLPPHQRAAAEKLFQSPGMAEAAKQHALRGMANAVPVVAEALKHVAAGIQGAAATGQVQGLTKLFAEGKAVPVALDVPIW